jgi:hypothetical protein
MAPRSDAEKRRRNANGAVMTTPIGSNDTTDRDDHAARPGSLAILLAF